MTIDKINPQLPEYWVNMFETCTWVELHETKIIFLHDTTITVCEFESIEDRWEAIKDMPDQKLVWKYRNSDEVKLVNNYKSIANYVKHWTSTDLKDRDMHKRMCPTHDYVRIFLGTSDPWFDREPSVLLQYKQYAKNQD